MKKIKNILAIILSVAMIISIVPATAFANDGPVPIEGEAVELKNNEGEDFSNGEEYILATSTNLDGDYYLESSTIFTAGLHVNENQNVTIDLNGHDLYLDGVIIDDGAELSITDSKEYEAGYERFYDEAYKYYYVNEAEHSVWCLTADKGTLSMPSAAVIMCKEDGIINNGTLNFTNANLIMNGYTSLSTDEAGYSYNHLNGAGIYNDGTISFENSIVEYFTYGKTVFYLNGGSEMTFKGGYIRKQAGEGIRGNDVSVFVEEGATFNLDDASIFNTICVGPLVVNLGTLKLSGAARIGDPLGLGGVSVFADYHKPADIESISVVQSGAIIIDSEKPLTKTSVSPSITLMPLPKYEDDGDGDITSVGYDDACSINIIGTDSKGCIGMALGGSAFTRTSTSDGFEFSRKTTEATNSLGLSIDDIVLTDGLDGVGLNFKLTGLSVSDTTRVNEFLKYAYNGYLLGKVNESAADSQYYNVQFPDVVSRLEALELKENEESFLREIVKGVTDLLKGEGGSPAKLSFGASTSSFTVLNNISIGIGQGTVEFSIRNLADLIDQIPVQLDKTAGNNLYSYFNNTEAGQAFAELIDRELFFMMQDYYDGDSEGIELGPISLDAEDINAILGLLCGTESGDLYTEEECGQAFDSLERKNAILSALDFASDYMDMDNGGIRSIFAEMLPALAEGFGIECDPIETRGRDLSDCIEDVLDILLESELSSMVDGILAGMLYEGFGVGFYQHTPTTAETPDGYKLEPEFSINRLFNSAGVYSIGMTAYEEDGDFSNTLGLKKNQIKNLHTTEEGEYFFLLDEQDFGALFDGEGGSRITDLLCRYNYKIGGAGSIKLPKIVCLMQRPELIEDYTLDSAEEKTGSVVFSPVDAGLLKQGMKVRLSIITVGTGETKELKLVGKENAASYPDICYSIETVEVDGIEIKDCIVVHNLPAQQKYQLSYSFSYQNYNTVKFKGETFETFIGSLDFKVAADKEQDGKPVNVRLLSGSNEIAAFDNFDYDEYDEPFEDNDLRIGNDGTSYGCSGRFEKLGDGYYNLKLEYGSNEYETSKLVQISDGLLVAVNGEQLDAENRVVQFNLQKNEGKFETATIINITKNDSHNGYTDITDEEIADVVVGGLDGVASELTKDNPGEYVKNVVLEVENLNEEMLENNDAAAMEGLIGIVKEDNVSYLDLSLYATVGTTTEEIHETSLLTIRIPYDTTRKDVTVYRYHNGNAEKLPVGEANASEDGEYCVIDRENGVIILHVCKFSVYAISYNDSVIAAGSSTYSITVADVKNGSIKLSTKNAAAGTKVTVTASADEGYFLKSVGVTDSKNKQISIKKNADGTYNFKMPESNVQVKAEFFKLGSYAECDGTNCPMAQFSDLNTQMWYHDAVHFCLESGIMNGYENGKFNPTVNCSRAMIVTMLWNLEGNPVVDYEMSFGDVAAAAWYAEAIRWAASTKLVSGYSETEFGPSNNITREQFVQIMYNYAVLKGADTNVDEAVSLAAFSDAGSAREWAVTALKWGLSTGLISGRSATVLAPAATASRAEAAQIFFNYLAK